MSVGTGWVGSESWSVLRRDVFLRHLRHDPGVILSFHLHVGRGGGDLCGSPFSPHRHLSPHTDTSVYPNFGPRRRENDTLDPETLLKE